MQEMGTEFEDALTKLTIRSGKQVVSKLNQLQDVSVFEEQDFIGALNFYKALKNKRIELPAKMRTEKGANPTNFINSQIKSLERALEAQDQ